MNGKVHFFETQPLTCLLWITSSYPSWRMVHSYILVIIIFLFCCADCVGTDAFITSVSVRRNTVSKLEQSWKLHRQVLPYGRSSCTYTCEILFTGTIRVPKKELRLWSSGYAILHVWTGQAFRKLHCKYMAHAGASTTPTVSSCHCIF